MLLHKGELPTNITVCTYGIKLQYCISHNAEFVFFLAFLEVNNNFFASSMGQFHKIVGTSMSLRYNYNTFGVNQT